VPNGAVKKKPPKLLSMVPPMLFVIEPDRIFSILPLSLLVMVPPKLLLMMPALLMKLSFNPVLVMKPVLSIIPPGWLMKGKSSFALALLVMVPVLVRVPELLNPVIKFSLLVKKPALLKKLPAELVKRPMLVMVPPKLLNMVPPDLLTVTPSFARVASIRLSNTALLPELKSLPPLLIVMTPFVN